MFLTDQTAQSDIGTASRKRYEAAAAVLASGTRAVFRSSLMTAIARGEAQETTKFSGVLGLRKELGVRQEEVAFSKVELEGG